MVYQVFRWWTLTYQFVVINDFLHGGGDNFTAFKGTKLVGAVGTDTDTFVNYIQTMTSTAKKVVATSFRS